MYGWQNIDENKTSETASDTITGSSMSNFIISKKQYKDFVLEMDIKADDGLRDLGISIRNNANWGYISYLTGKLCTISAVDGSAGGIYDNTRGWLYPVDLNNKVKNSYKPRVYNHVKIECIGSEIKTWINNIATAYVVDTIDNAGYIGFQM